jgi:hypothetical protein
MYLHAADINDDKSRAERRLASGLTARWVSFRALLVIRLADSRPSG